MLTCACGARFEVDASHTGQEILCPECRQPVPRVGIERPPAVTSGWALASLLLALIGAFTVLCTILAVVLGVIALASIGRQRDRLTGAGFAVSGICLGVLFTVLTLVALSTADVFGLESWLRERSMTQEIDTTGPLEIVQGNTGFALTRPTEEWGQLQDNHSSDPAVGALQHHLDLLLTQLPRHAFIDVRTLPFAPFRSLDQYETDVLADFKIPRNLFDDDDKLHPPAHIRRMNSSRLHAKEGMEGRALEVELRCAGKPWHFLIRLYRRGHGRIYVIRAYAPKRRFGEVRGELEAALDSFRILRR